MSYKINQYIKERFMADDGFTCKTGAFNPDLHDLLNPEDSQVGVEAKRIPSSPGPRKSEKSGHVKLCRRPHPGNRK